MTELESLQNAAQNIGMGFNIHEYQNSDKRKTVKLYYLQFDGITSSPCLDYDNMNHFLLGFLKAKKIYNIL